MKTILEQTYPIKAETIKARHKKRIKLAWLGVWLVTVVCWLLGTGSLQASVTVTPGSLFYFASNYPPSQPVAEAASVPASPVDIALTSGGATPFAVSQYGGPHTVGGLTDGKYGNSVSWMTESGARAVTLGGSYGSPTMVLAGVALPSNAVFLVNAFALGRNATGQYDDRHIGTNYVQITTAFPVSAVTDTSAGADTRWTTVGAFTSLDDKYDHMFVFSNAVQATGLRIVTSSGNVIDDLCVFGSTSMTLVEEGGAIASTNLANGKTALALDQLQPGGPSHTIPHLIDQTFGNGNSWISGGATAVTLNYGNRAWVGVSLGATALGVGGIAFGRDNPGSFTDRTLNSTSPYVVQYTQVSNPTTSTPDTGNPSTGWADLGSVIYVGAGPAPFAFPAKRHRYSFPAVNATGVRVLVPDTSICIDELEIYSGVLAITITAQPQPQVAPLNQTATFSVTATATNPPLTYQWYRNDFSTPIAGGTNSTLVLSNVTAAINGSSNAVIITDAGGIKATSSWAGLTILEWVVNADLGNGNTYSGQGGIPAPGNYWNIKEQMSGTGGPKDSTTNSLANLYGYTYYTGGVGNWPGLGGANSDLNDDGVYSGGQPGDPVTTIITLGPQATAADRYTVAAYIAIPGYATETYTFTLGTNTKTATTVAGTGGATLVEGQNYVVFRSVAPLLATNWGDLTQLPGYSGYYLKFDALDNRGDINCHIAGYQIALVLGTRIIPPITISSQPQPQQEVVGRTAYFSVTATGTNPPLSYQWYSNTLSAPISGANSATLTLTNVQLADSGSSNAVIITDAGGLKATSSWAGLTVSASLPVAALPTSASGNLTLWLNGGAGLTTSGGNVTAWADQSGTSRSVTINGTLTTTNQDLGSGAQPGVVFNGNAANYITLPSPNTLGLSGTNWEVFFVARAGDTIQFLMAVADNYFEMHLTPSAAGFPPAGLRFIANGGVSTLSDYYGPSATYGQVYAARVAGATGANTGTSIASINGLDASPVGSTSAGSSASALLLGRRAGGAYPLNGTISEVVIYNRGLTTLERYQVNQYLVTKYFVKQGVLWDADGANPVGMGGTGTWNTADNRWYESLNGTFRPWNNAYNDDAVFQGNGTVTLSGGINANSLSFHFMTAGDSYTLTGGTLTNSSGAVSVGLTNGGSATVGSVLAGTSGLTKTGPGPLTLSGANIYTGGTVVNNGLIVLSGAGLLGDSTGGVTVNGSTAGLDLGGLTRTNGAVVLGNGSIINGTLRATSFAATNGTISAILDGDGTAGFTKDGAGTVVLSGVNTYGGTTLVAGGTLVASGTLAGPASVTAAGTLAVAGTNALGTLTINNTLVLAGTVRMEIERVSGTLTNDQIAGVSTLTCGGILTMVLASGSEGLAPGDSFKLFNATNYTGHFTTVNLPSLTSGWTWDTSQLETSGLIIVLGPISIAAEPQDQVAVATKAAVFNVTAGGGTLPNRFQWYRNDFSSPIAGATNSTLTLLNVQLSDNGSSNAVIITDSTTPTALSVTSRWAQLTVIPAAVALPASASGNLTLWLDGGNGLTNSGANVTGWGDLSGNNRAVTVNGTLTWAYQDWGNGLAHTNVVFPGNAANYLTLPSPDVLGLSGTNYDVFIVAWHPDAIYFLMGLTPNEYFEMHVGMPGLRFIPSFHVYADYVGPSGTFGQVYAGRVTGASGVGTGSGISSIDGLDSAAVGTTAAASSANPLVIGKRGDNDYPLNGAISEVVIYNRALTAAERAQVNSYLMTKYFMREVAWDGDGTGNPGPNGGNGTWDTFSRNWYDYYTGGYRAWMDANNDDASFLGNGTVSLSGNLSANSVVFHPLATTDTYTLNGGTLTNSQFLIPASQMTVNSILAGSGGLVKQGAGTLVLGGANLYTGTTVVNAGSLTLSGTGTLGGGGGGGVLVNGSTAVLNLGGLIRTNGAIMLATGSIINGMLWGTSFVATNGTISANLGGDGTVGLTKDGTGTVVLSGTNTYGGTTLVANGAMTVSGALGNGPVTIGGGTMTVSGAVGNGDVTVSGGTLTGNGSLGNGIVTVNGGTVTVSGTVGSGTVTVNGGLLAGTGTYGGPTTVQVGGTLAPAGSNTIGTLTINSDLTLYGNTVMDTRKTGGVLTNDLIRGVGTLTCGGTLTVVLVSGSQSLVNGDAIKLFNAVSYGGSFPVIHLPPLRLGLFWDTTKLLTNGTISVTNVFVGPLMVGVEPTDQQVMANKTAFFSAAGWGGTAPYTYQWYSNSLTSPVAGAVGSALTLPNAPLADDGTQYAVIITDNASTSVTSRWARLLVNAGVPVLALPSSASGNLTLWLDGDNGLTNSSGLLSGWADQSGHGRAVTVNGTLGVTNLDWGNGNSNSGVFFNGNAANYLGLTTAANLGINNTNYAIFIVAGQVADAIQFLLAGDQEKFEMHLCTTNNATHGLRFLPNTGVQAFADYSGPSSTFGQVYAGRVTGSYGANTGAGIGSIDAVETLFPQPNAATDSTAPLILGRRTDGSYPLNGAISEVIIYNRELTAAEVRQVNDYLLCKYFVKQGLVWDGDGVGLPGPGGGSGTWDTTNSRWYDNLNGGFRPWVNADNNDASFLGGGTVTLSEGIQVHSLTFHSLAAADTYVFTGENLTNTSGLFTVGNNPVTISNVVAGTSGVTKHGRGTLILAGANTYTGGTAVSQGTLEVTTDGSLAADQVAVATGATLKLSFVGTKTVSGLSFDGIPQPFGTWGALGSGATYTDGRLQGTGLLNVLVPPPALLAASSLGSNSMVFLFFSTNMNLDFGSPVFGVTNTGTGIGIEVVTWSYASELATNGNLSVLALSLASPLQPATSYTTTVQDLYSTADVLIFPNPATAVFMQPALRVTGRVALEGFVGASRAVVFKATDSGGTVKKTWTNTLSFVSGEAGYALDNVPSDTVRISAKTAWNLRKRVDASFSGSVVGVANFTGDFLLPAGDLDESNTVGLDDYYLLAAAWYQAIGAADIDGNGVVDLDDYFLLTNQWGQPADLE